MIVRISKLICATLLLLLCASHPRVFAEAPLRVAVVEFDTMGNLEIRDAGKIIAEWMITALTKEGKYDVKAREVLLKKVLREQTLAKTGIIDEKTALEIGKIYGVQYIVTGSVTSWNKVVTVEARLIDAQTGSVVKAESVRSENPDGIPDKIQTLASVLSGNKNAQGMNMPISNSTGNSGVNKPIKPSNMAVNGFVILDIRFYETPWETKFSERKYATVFDPGNTRYICTEVKYSNPNYKIRDATFNAAIEYLYPDGTSMCMVRYTPSPKKEWATAYFHKGWGNRNAGMAWKTPGQYTANVYFEGILVGTAYFTVR